MGKKLIIRGADFSANAIGPEPEPIEYTLSNGYASKIGKHVEIDSGESANLIRVRTSEISGNYNIKTKPGYVIRAIVKYDTKLNITVPGDYASTNVVDVPDVEGLSEYSMTTAEGKWSIITLCKTDSTEAISASEDIVDYIRR